MYESEPVVFGYLFLILTNLVAILVSNSAYWVNKTRCTVPAYTP